jgi:hypothetical protein
LEYAAEQLAAGFRAMTMLTGYVRRGGRPAAVAPTISLRPGEKQYGWFPVAVDGERRLAVITSRRLIVGGEDFELSRIARVRPVAGEWSVVLDLRGGGSLTLAGPWVPWLGVVLCAELYGTAAPPPARAVPEPRRCSAVSARTARKKLMASVDRAARGLRG